VEWLFFLHAALLAYKTVPGTKKLKKLVHLVVQFLAMFFSLIGLWAVWKFHDERKIDHLYTLHSWLGLTCFIFFSLQVRLRDMNPSVQFFSYIFHISPLWSLCLNLCSGLLGFGPFGTPVDQEVAVHFCFPGMSFLVYSSMFLLSPQV
jgi:hypothetical protein